MIRPPTVDDRLSGSHDVGRDRLEGRRLKHGQHLVGVDPGGKCGVDRGDEVFATVLQAGLRQHLGEPSGRFHPITTAGREHQMLCRHPVLAVANRLRPAVPTSEQLVRLVDKRSCSSSNTTRIDRPQSAALLSM